MAEKKKKRIEKAAPDRNRFYPTVEGYIEFCVHKPKTKLTDKEKEGLEESVIVSKENELSDAVRQHEKQKKIFQNKYDEMCKEISQNGISYLTEYVDALKKLSADHSDWKRDLKSLLVDKKFLKIFREARAQITELYPLLLSINQTFTVDEYSELSLSPKSAMYGSEIGKTQNGITKKPPMTNKEYQGMLMMFQQVKDFKRFEDWLMAILVYAPDQMLDECREKYAPERETLKKWAYDQIKSSKPYREAVSNVLLKKAMLHIVMDAYAAKPRLEKKQAELEAEIKRLQEAGEQEKTEHEERRRKQYEKIEQQRERIAELNNTNKDLDKLRLQLNRCSEVYQAQISMNERITIENDRRIREMETGYGRIQDELAGTKARFDELQTAYTALQSDYSLRNNELDRLKNMAAQEEEKARTNMMRELVSGINEQFYYLAMFYLELKENGKLEPESIELYADTLNNIDIVLAELGIQKIGVINQTVAYDASIHDSLGTKVSNGDKVVVTGYGWKIGEEIYIKAPVEKGDQ